MRKFFLISNLILVLFALLSAGTLYLKPIPKEIKAKPLPEFYLKDINLKSDTFGKTLSLDQYKGQILLVYFGSLG